MVVINITLSCGGLISPAVLQPSLLLQVQYSMNILNVPVLIKQNRSSPTIPGSPIYAQLRKYLHSPCTKNKAIKELT